MGIGLQQFSEAGGAREVVLAKSLRSKRAKGVYCKLLFISFTP